MNDIERAEKETRFKPVWLATVFPLAMVIPNILLDITDTMPVWMLFVNVMFPLSLYYSLTTGVRNVGAAVLWTVPLIAMNVFQIVITYLFGESIIAIDMLTNVVTTNPSEAGELLSQLSIPLVISIIIYVPLLVWAIWLVTTKRRSPVEFRRRWFRWSIGVAVLMLAVFVIGMIAEGNTLQLRNLYPYNVCSNIVNASKRFNDSMNYPETSKDFSYKATDGHPAGREIHLMVIGETSRAGNWELQGYARPTNPRLSKLNDITYFNRAVSQSNTTHKCVPMMLSVLTPHTFGDSITLVKSIVSAFKESGYKTAFFTTQPPNHSYTENFALEADTVKFLPPSQYNDMVLADMFKGLLADSTATKLFVVLHTYGSHFCYLDRYPKSFSYFSPDDATNATSMNKDQLVNAYDNTIRYTDSFLADLIEALSDQDAVSTMLYVSDHGEDIFDDERERFLHASPTPTYYQLHVPMIVWMSDQYRNLYPEKYSAVSDNSHSVVAPPENVFHTLLDMSGLQTPYFDSSKSVSSHSFKSPDLLFLNDYNEAAPLINSGIKQPDVDKFKELGVM